MSPQDEQAPASPALNSPQLATEEHNNSGTSTPLANAPSSEEGDEENEHLPLTLAASVVLSDLPQDASAALAETVANTGPLESKKVVVRFKGVGSAPQLAQDVCKISASRKFEEVVRYLRRKLKCKDTDSVFLYVNSAFAPSLDEVVGNLHQCFKNASDQLVVAYSMTPAFG